MEIAGIAARQVERLVRSVNAVAAAAGCENVETLLAVMSEPRKLREAAV